MDEIFMSDDDAEDIDDADTLSVSTISLDNEADVQFVKKVQFDEIVNVQVIKDDNE